MPYFARTRWKSHLTAAHCDHIWIGWDQGTYCSESSSSWYIGLIDLLNQTPKPTRCERASNILSRCSRDGLDYQDHSAPASLAGDRAATLDPIEHRIAVKKCCAGGAGLPAKCRNHMNGSANTNATTRGVARVERQRLAKNTCRRCHRIIPQTPTRRVNRQRQLPQRTTRVSLPRNPIPNRVSQPW